jgi:Icc-related predicted phosphoesterase
MRIFTVSDLHVDYAENLRWVSEISRWDYRSDVLLCAGDISQNMSHLGHVFESLRARFSEVLYVPGNHELWLTDRLHKNSVDRFHGILEMAAGCGVRVEPLTLEGVSLVPLFAWYDFSFGNPSDHLRELWVDFKACQWPESFDAPRIAEHFLAMNRVHLRPHAQPVISFSHFVPRRDLLPGEGWKRSFLSPVLGSVEIEKQIRQIGSTMHVYGHFHVNGRHERDDVTYINNAFGYPQEKNSTAKQLACIFEV